MQQPTAWPIFNLLGGNRLFSIIADTDTPPQNTLEDDELYSKIIIEAKGHDASVLDSYQTFVSMAASELDVLLTSMPVPRYDVERYTLLKSAHIYKKHFRQYEIRTHYRILEARKLTGSTASTFLEYIQRNLPEGVAMKVTKYRLESLPAELRPAGVQQTGS